MRSTRALIVSFGAGLSVVTAAALSLLAVSAVIALQGWPGLGAVPAAGRPVLLADQALVAAKPAGGASRGAVVLTSERQPVARRRPSRPRVVVLPQAQSTAREARSSAPQHFAPAPAPEQVATLRPSPPASAAAPAPLVGAPSPPRPRSGDVLRKTGDDLAGTVQGTGRRLDDAVKPLSPPVGKLLSDTTTLVGRLLQETTGLLGGAADRLLSSPVSTG